ncbi:Asp23/Gls24 family envelope stress response protein, partial [Weissella confusa]
GFVANIKNKIVNSDNPTDGIDVEVGKEQVAVDLNIVMEFGHNAHDVYKEISKVVAKQIEEATSLTLVELNVKVIDIQTKSEFEESQVTIQDRVTDAGKSVQDKATAGIDKVKSVTDSDDARVQ